MSAGPAYPVAAARDPRTPTLVEQSPRTINFAALSWDDLMAILREAERGNTVRLADLTRRMLRDGHYASNVETRKLAVATAKVAIEPASDDPIDVKGAEDAQRMVDGLPMSRIKKDMADAIPTGWACLQIHWEPRGAWLWPAAVTWNHPRRFRFGYDFKPYIYDDGRAAADQDKLTEEERRECARLGIIGMPLEPYRWIVHMPRAFPDFPNMGGVAVEALTAWWIKANALRYQLAGAETGGNGRIWGEQDPQADATTKAAFLENLGKFGAGEIIVTSPGAKVNFINPMAQGSDGIFTSLIEWANAEMSKAVLGSTLAVEAGPTGSRAQAETQKDATIDPRAEVDDDEIRYTLHRDLVDVFLELNRWAYGGRKPNVKTTSVWVEEEATIDELALKTGLITKNQFLQSRGLPALDVGGDEFIVMPDAAPAFGALPLPGAADLPTAADGTKVEAVADTALNGAQVTSLGAIMEQLAAGTLALETAVLFITSSFPSIPEERARRMVEAQAALAPPPAPVADVTAPLASLPDITPGSQWTDTSDGHAVTVTAVGNGRVYFTDADYVNEKGEAQPGRQHSYAEPTFRERCSPVVSVAMAKTGFAIGDRVTVLPGKDHNGAGVGEIGVIREVNGSAYGIEFPSMPGEIHRWYTGDELQAAPGGASAASPLPSSDGDSGGFREPSSGSALSSEAHGDLWALSEEDRSRALIAVGHPGLLTAQAMLDGVPLFERMRSSLIDAAGKADSVATLSGALAKWARRKETALTEQLREVALHGRMAGALFVAQYEAPEVFANGPVALEDRPVPPFLALPFDEAIAAFEARRVVTPEEFEAMDEAARRDAFTATQLAHETLVQRARDLLLRTLRDGGTFDDFRRALVEDESALGVTPSAPWYLETVYRSNVASAYATGRMDLLTSPAVRAVRPYLEWRTSRDSRVRDTHAEMEGAIFLADDPNIRDKTPPYLNGVYQFNERCLVVARRAEDVDLSRLIA